MGEFDCPWENRRESSEVTYSFIATCFAAFAAYGHLEHSLLGNHNSIDITGKMLLFFFCPSAPLVDLVVLRLLPALATCLGFRRAERVEFHSGHAGPYLTSTTGGLQFLLAQIAGMHASKAQQDAVSAPVARSSHRRFHLEQREESSSIRTGQALALSFLTMQCLGAVIKGSRRLARGSGLHSGDPQQQPAVVLADAETLWYALSGLCILTCSWTAFVQNKDWELAESEDTSNDHQVSVINTVALVLLCSLFSTFGYVDFYYNEPFWHVGFFHFLYPVPYLYGWAGLETPWDVRRRILVTRVAPSIISVGVPILVSTILLHRNNRVLIAIFWISGLLSFGSLALSPVLEVVWEQILLWNKSGLSATSISRAQKLLFRLFRGFQILSSLQPRWRWGIRALAAVIGTILTTAVWTRTNFVSGASKRTQKLAWCLLLWYSFSAISLILFAANWNTLQSIRSLRDHGTDWPCPELWQDPLFIPSF